MYRGQPWYVLSNPLTGTNHRFDKSSYLFICQLDGIRTVQEIWDSLESFEGTMIPTQNDCILLLARLHQDELMQSDILPSTLALIQGTPPARQGWKQQLRNPFYLRLPLWNPDRFLSRMQGRVAPLMSIAGLYLWAVVVLTALILAGVHWPDLQSNWADHLLTPTGLLTLWLAYPLLKGLHELGHAFAVKHWGGEIHEMGITLLVFTPVPYVDASASAAFAEKRQRIAVAAMGMMIELFVASLALFVWLNVENGMVRVIWPLISPSSVGCLPCCSMATHCCVTMATISSLIWSRFPNLASGPIPTWAISSSDIYWGITGLSLR